MKILPGRVMESMWHAIRRQLKFGVIGVVTIPPGSLRQGDFVIFTILQNQSQATSGVKDA